MLTGLLLTGCGGGAEEHPGLLSSVRGLPGAAGRQVVLSEQLHHQKPDGLERRGGTSLHLAPRPGCPDQVRAQITLLISKASRCSCSTMKTWKKFDKIKFYLFLLSFRDASVKVSGLREKLEEVNWTVGAVNHTFTNDISIHNLKIQDLQVHHILHKNVLLIMRNSYCSCLTAVYWRSAPAAQIQISNITEDTSSLWVTHVHTEAQLRNEMEILNTITEDLRLKDWEHSMALKNLTIIEGQLREMDVCSDCCSEWC